MVVGDRATLTGTIIDNRGQPIEHATVLVYHAGLKRGYSTFCPSCYADCGKRTITGTDGAFVFRGLDPELHFELVVLRDGFQPTLTKWIDPSGQDKTIAVLSPRQAISQTDRVVRGRVVDGHQSPLRDAIVLPLGVSGMESGNGTPGEASYYGTVPGLDPLTVTDGQGNFEVAYRYPSLGMLLQVEARGFALKVQALTTGVDRKTIIVARGAAIRGRLVSRGQPVAGVQIALSPVDRGGGGSNLKIFGDPYKEVQVGTQADGTFVLADVPSPVNWYLYPTMESTSTRGALVPVRCTTKHSGEIVDVGDLSLTPGHYLTGTVALRDGASIPDGMHVMISSREVSDSQVIALPPDGRFACGGLPTGDYEILPMVQGYSSPEGPRVIHIDRDTDTPRMLLDRKPHS